VSTKPTLEHLYQLEISLLDAFDHASLTHLTRVQLDLNLEWVTPVAGKQDLTTIISDLVAYLAAQEGGLYRLLTAALEDNPQNAQLLALQNDWSDLVFTPIELPQSHPSKTVIHTSGGAAISGNVEVQGDFTGRDKIVQGDEVYGDKFRGDKVIGTKIVINQPRADGTTVTIEATLSPPPEPTRPPTITNFVGRDEELTYFSQTLDERNLAIVAGMAGVGKTALAVTLTQWVAEPENVFWHTFHEGEGIDTTIRRLAGFLAWHGADDLWQLLEIARITGGQPPSSSEQFDYVVQLLRTGNYLLCFDDFHEVEHDPTFGQLISKLQNALGQRYFSLIVTSRRAPDFVNVSAFEPLTGLSKADANRLIATANVQLTTDQIDTLHDVTGGNSEFLTLTIDALNQGKDPDELLSRLAESDDIQRYLLQEIDDLLSGDERSVMNAVAILLGYGGTRDVIEEILNGRNVFRTLRRLTDRHLLTAQQVDAEQTYNQHAIVRTFYYDQLSRKQRQRLHLRAGDFYAEDEQALLHAGIHLERAGSMTESAQMATRDVSRIINQGEIRPLRTLLERFTGEQLSPKLWIEVNLAKGQVYVLQADPEKGEESLHEAIRHIETVEEEKDQRILKAKAYRGMGELIQRSAPPQALEWLEKGLDALGDTEPLEAAILHIRSGTIQFFLGQYEESFQSSQSGMNLLPEGPSQWRSRALIDMSSVNNVIGDFQQSINLTTEAIEICKQFSDPINQIPAVENLAIAKFSSGDIRGGFDTFNDAASLANQIGNEAALTQIEMNLGTAYLDTGEFEQAKAHLHTSLDLATRHDDKRTYLFALRNLIDLHVDQGEWEVAQQYLEKAEPLARELGDQHNLMTIFGLRCEVALADEDMERALDCANQRWQLAIELDEVVQQGNSQAFLGKTLAAMERYEEAFAAFEQSLVLIKDEHPYKMAVTKMMWGKALLAAKRLDGGIVMLIEAQGELRDLEEVFHVEQIDEILAAYDAAGLSTLTQESG